MSVSFASAEIENGGFSIEQGSEGGLNASVRRRSAHAEARIESQVPLGGADSGQVAGCTTGAIEASLDRISRREYRKIVERAPFG